MQQRQRSIIISEKLPLGDDDVVAAADEGEEERRDQQQRNINSSSNDNNSNPNKYNALVVDSGAIIKGTALLSSSSSTSPGGGGLLHCATNYYTVPGVLSEIRDVKSRQLLQEFQNRLTIASSSGNRSGESGLIVRTPAVTSIRAVLEFSRKTGDLRVLSNVDVQLLALLYELEKEANGYADGSIGHHVRTAPRGYAAAAATGGGGGRHDSNSKSNSRKDDVDQQKTTTMTSTDTIGEGAAVKMTIPSSFSSPSFFRSGDDDIVDASLLDYDYDDDERMNDNNDQNVPITTTAATTTDSRSETLATENGGGGGDVAAKKSSWALIVNPDRASTMPLVNYSIGSTTLSIKTTATTTTTATNATTIVEDNDINDNDNDKSVNDMYADYSDDDDDNHDDDDHDDDVKLCGQFDDASSSHSSSSLSLDGEMDALDVANANSDDELPDDEECDVYILEPHEAVYYKCLREEKAKTEAMSKETTRNTNNVLQCLPEVNDEETETAFRTDRVPSLMTDFPSPQAVFDVPPREKSNGIDVVNDSTTTANWQEEETERKRKAILPMINGRPVLISDEHSTEGTKTLPSSSSSYYYNSFRMYGDVVSASGSAAAAVNTFINKMREMEVSSLDCSGITENTLDNEMSSSAATTTTATRTNDTLAQEYKSRIPSVAIVSQSDNLPVGFSSEMTADDDDGEGWVTCARDIHAMKAAGSLDPNNCNNNNNIRLSNMGDCGIKSSKGSGVDNKYYGPPIHRRAACATTDFAMQNVILQMNLELVTIDGVRVRRLKTWVTRCGACFTVYAGDKAEKVGGRLFCDKCGSNLLQRIACSVDKGTGRLRLHMKKNYRVNTRGTKFSLPKPGKVSWYSSIAYVVRECHSYAIMVYCHFSFLIYHMCSLGQQI